MPENADSMARNEELFRQVNEQIEEVSKDIPREERTMEFLCECDRIDCFERITATRSEYESVRAVSTHFIVVPAHVDARIEHVAFATERFAVVEKEGEAARDAADNDPRADE
jgi:hypothetical protein